MSFEFESNVTAYHEAGHILLAERYGGQVIFASILPSDDHGIRSHGETRAIWPSVLRADAAKHALNLAKIALAGPAAEMIYSDEQYEPRLLREWWSDWVAADAAIREAQPRQMSDQQRVHLLSQLVHELIRVLSIDAVWDRIAMIADHLEAHETLEQDQLDELRDAGFFG